MKTDLDILILALPLLHLGHAPGGPAMIKSAAVEAGYLAKAFDTSIDFFINECNRTLTQFDELGTCFRPTETPDVTSLTAMESWLSRTIDFIKKSNTAIVGLSVFTTFQHRAAYKLSERIRKELPNIKIVAGGLGLDVNGTSLNGLITLSKIETLNPFHLILENKGLVDYVVLGPDGLTDIVNILKKEINNDSKEILVDHKKSVLYKSPIPDYDDYSFDEYQWAPVPQLAITGSKGCVRKCTFCDVPGQFGQFRMRTGADIAKEIIYQADRYGIKKFEFTDSLVNGSLKAFKDWLTPLAEYNDKLPEQEKITWQGQYICRPSHEMPEEYYDLMKRSGAVSLVVGVESGSDDVLDAMKKKMKTSDVFDELEMFEKYGLKAHVLMLSGFINEDRALWIETLTFLVKLQKYVASRVIGNITIGTPLFITSKTHLYLHADELGIDLDLYNDGNWVSKTDPYNNLVQRVANRTIQQDVVDSLYYPTSDQTISHIYTLKKTLQHLDNNVVMPLQLDDTVGHIPLEIKKMLEPSKDFKLELTLKGSAVNEIYPKAKVSVNNQTLFNGKLVSETITFSLTEVNKVSIEIKMYGKELTTIDQQGNILENQEILIDKFFINDIDILQSGIIYDLGCYNMNVSKEKEKLLVNQGITIKGNHSLVMGENGVWTVETETPILNNFCRLNKRVEFQHKWPNPKLVNDIWKLIKQHGNELPN